MDSYLGQIELFSFGFAPMGWVSCEGQALQIAQNQALYSLIGTKFGGSSTTFQLPDLRNASPIAGMAYYICISGLYPVRD